MVLALLPTLLLSGPGSAFRCEKKCALTDDAARFCMSSKVKEQVSFADQYGKLPSMAEDAECMGLDLNQTLITQANAHISMEKNASFAVQVSTQQTGLVSLIGLLHSGISPPEAAPYHGLQAIPSQHAPPAGLHFS